MNKVFEKILDRLEDELTSTKTKCGTNVDFDKGICKSQEIVQEVAEEYKDGWVPCSEKLPEDDSICIVTVEYPNNKTMVDYGWFDRKNVCWFVGMQEFRTSNILAWQPLPEPYKERDSD